MIGKVLPQALPTRLGVAVVLALLLVLGPARASDVHPDFQGKLVVGYQGWFGCPGDFANNTRWQHWVVNDAGHESHPSVEMIPDLQGFDDDEVCPSAPGMGQVRLFSSQTLKTVRRHFQWMKTFGIQAVALQRFATHLRGEEDRKRLDNVLRNVRASASESGRSYFIEYDVTGVDKQTWVADVTADWRRLVDEFRVTADPGYLFFKGKPVLGIFGLGFDGAQYPEDPLAALGLLDAVADPVFPMEGAALFGGVPARWRTLGGDASGDPRWTAVYKRLDIISPWTVGRFRTISEADHFMETNFARDLALTKKMGALYAPTLFPGASWSNRERSPAAFNAIPRRCGDFFERQAANILNAGSTTAFLAMFDELDEGTAILPAARRAQLDRGLRFLGPDSDGCDLRSDFYLERAGSLATKLARTFDDPFFRVWKSEADPDK